MRLGGGCMKVKTFDRRTYWHWYEIKKRVVARCKREGEPKRAVLAVDPRFISFDFFLECVGFCPDSNYRLRMYDRALGYVPGNIYWKDASKEKNQPHFVDLTGKRYGSWTVLGAYRMGRTSALYSCKCDCGTVRDVSATALTRGGSRGCKFCTASRRLAASIEQQKGQKQ